MPAALIGSPLCAESVNVNEFGNLVLPKHVVSNEDGTPPIRDAGGSQSQNTNDDVFQERFTDLIETIDGIIGSVDDVLGQDPQPPGIDFDEINAMLLGLERIRAIVEAKPVGLRPTSFIMPVNTLEVNTPDFSFFEDVVGALAAVELTIDIRDGPDDRITSDDVNGALRLLANADPFITMTGAITNLSETESINAFVPFELAFEDPVALDTPLVRQAYIAAHLNDTNDDGEASLRDASVQFSFFATEDPTDPTSENTQSIGLTEALGVSRIPVDRLIERVGPVEPIDQSFIDRVTEDASFSHLLGEIRILDISPGDTVSFRAIVSVGDPNDPNLPFLNAQDLNLMLSAIELVGRFQVPEPSNVWLIVSLIGLALPAHSRSGPTRQA